MVVVFSACPRAVRPDVRVPITLSPTVWARDTQIHYYDVAGDTEAELRAELDAKGPENDGVRHDAYTSWFVTWRYPFVHSDQGCATGPVTTDVKVVVTLPRWLGYADETQPLMKRWRRYLDALKTHESGHRETGFRAASDISDTLQELPPKATCDEVDEAATVAARAVLEKYRKADADYDNETRHGEAQGAVFP